MDKRLWFKSVDGLLCYTIESHLDDMSMNDEPERVLFLARPVKIEGLLWCNWYGDSMEKGDCGRHCKHYDPRNGKSGACKLLGRFYEPDVTASKTVQKPTNTTEG